MLSNTGLYATQPSRFEKFENGDDFLSYAPISDLSLSGTSPLPDLSNQINDPFLSCFTSAENFDSFDDWTSQNNLSGLDTWESSDLENNTMDQSSPFQSPLMDWASSPSMSSQTSNGGFSPINGSSQRTSMSLDTTDFTLEFPIKPSTEITTPSERSTSPDTESPTLSQDEIAKLWTIAFPNSRAPSAIPETKATTTIIPATTTTPITNPTPTIPLHQKRKSLTPHSIPSFTTTTSPISPPSPTYPAQKKRHTLDTTRTRTPKRPSPTPTSSSVKGSKVNHNLIEKRYRSSLNEKIALLRDALPKNYNSSGSEEEEDLFVTKREELSEGYMGSSEGKLSTKGAVLSDAARYIRFLEGKVWKLEERLGGVGAY